MKKGMCNHFLRNNKGKGNFYFKIRQLNEIYIYMCHFRFHNVTSCVLLCFFPALFFPINGRNCRCQPFYIKNCWACSKYFLCCEPNGTVHPACLIKLPNQLKLAKFYKHFITKLFKNWSCFFHPTYTLCVIKSNIK